jgi:hypothetical protein
MTRNARKRPFPRFVLASGARHGYFACHALPTRNCCWAVGINNPDPCLIFPGRVFLVVSARPVERFAGGVVEGYFLRMPSRGAGNPAEERNDGDRGVVPKHKVPVLNRLETLPWALVPRRIFHSAKAVPLVA